LQAPVPIDALNCALEAAELIIIELDAAGGHAADRDLLMALEREDLVQFRPIDEL